MIHIRNSVIVMLCITVICMAFGFIVLSVYCKNEADKIDSFDVSFSDVRKTSSVRGTDLEPYGNIDITNSGLELDMSFVLNGGNDELSYIATIKNNGTLPAEIVDVIESPDYREDSFKKSIFPVSISISDIKGKIIPPGDDVELKIVVYYTPSSSLNSPKSIPLKLGLLVKSR